MILETTVMVHAVASSIPFTSLSATPRGADGIDRPEDADDPWFGMAIQKKTFEKPR